MNIKIRNKTVLLFAVMAAAMLVASAGAEVISIDFDNLNKGVQQGIVQSGEPTHHLGLTLPGQVGDWHQLSTGSSGDSPTITVSGVTLTVNTTGASYNVYSTGSNVLREDFFWLNTADLGPIQWELTGLTPNGTYNIICYGRYDPAWGGYRQGDMSIAGFNDGNPVEQEKGATVDDVFIPEGDWNFEGVTADATGKIAGTFAWIANHAEWGGIQFEEATPENPGAATVVAGSDWVTWSGKPFTLDDAAVTNNDLPAGDLTFEWTAEDVAGISVGFSATDVIDPTVVITKAADTGEATVVTLTLTVTQDGKLPVVSSMQVDVYDNACGAAEAVGSTVTFDTSDINKDCITDLKDFAEMAAVWLYDYTLTEAAAVN